MGIASHHFSDAHQPTGVPLRALGMLTATVLVAHYGLLTLTPGSFGFKEPSLSRPLTTRTVVLGSTPVVKPATSALPAPVLKPKPPSAGVYRPFAAIDSVAIAVPAPTELAPLPTPAPPAATPIDAPAQTPKEAAEPPAVAARPPRDSAPALGPLAIPGSIRLKYTVQGQQGTQPMAGATSELAWLHDGKDYDARLTIKTLFFTLRSHTSAGSLGESGLAPKRYSEKTRSELAAHFEADKGKIIFSANTPDAPLLSGAQDRLSLFFQLAGLLAAGPERYPVASTLTLQTVGPRDADTWLFTVDGEETLALPIGSMLATKLTRNPRREYDQKVELWFAPSLGYLPVRIKITQSNGDFADQQLRATDKP